MARLQSRSDGKTRAILVTSWSVFRWSRLWSPHLVKTPNTYHSLSNPTNPCVLTAVSNLKPALSCGAARRWIDNWKVKHRRLIFDSGVVLKAAAPPRAGGPRLPRLMWETPVNQSSGWALGGASIPPSLHPSIPPSLGWVLMPTWGTGGEGSEGKPRFSDSTSILSLSSWAESQPLCS